MNQLKLTARFKKPIAIRRVVGSSMEPTLKPGSIVFFSSLLTSKSGDIVLATVQQKDFVKRLNINEGAMNLIGDNKQDSTDVHNPRIESISKYLFKINR